LTRARFYLSVRVAHTAVRLCSDVSHKKLNLALREGRARNLCHKIEFILALNYYYYYCHLQFIIQFIEDKQQQTQSFYLFSSFLNSLLREDGDAAIGSIDVRIYKLAKVCFHLFLFT